MFQLVARCGGEMPGGIQMSAGTEAAIGLSIKAGIAAAAGAVVVSIVATSAGLVVMPPDSRNPGLDIARRFAGGLFTSFTIGPIVAIKAFEWWPSYLTMWQTTLGDLHPLWPFFIGACPFIAASALPGFWVVAAVLRWFHRRADKDVGELIQDARSIAQKP